MKKILFALTLILATTSVQTNAMELGLMGGYRTDGTWTGSMVYYFNVWRLQFGPVVEVSNIERNFTILNTTSTLSYTQVSPGLNANFRIPFKRGYVYPGVTGRYQLGSDGTYAYRGIDYGINAGIVVNIIGKVLALNAETGFRVSNIKQTLVSSGADVTSVSTPFVPAQLGIRLRF